MTNFDLKTFTPYLLNIAAERSSLAFQPAYKDSFGMLRTEWRVLFHIGQYGAMTAKEICARARLHKTKVSRAVSALEAKRFLTRSEVPSDRRHETLSLTKTGTAAFQDISRAAQKFDEELMSDFSRQEQEILRNYLAKIAGL